MPEARTWETTVPHVATGSKEELLLDAPASQQCVVETQQESPEGRLQLAREDSSFTLRLSVSTSASTTTEGSVLTLAEVSSAGAKSGRDLDVFVVLARVDGAVPEDDGDAPDPTRILVFTMVVSEARAEGRLLQAVYQAVSTHSDRSFSDPQQLAHGAQEAAPWTSKVA